MMTGFQAAVACLALILIAATVPARAADVTDPPEGLSNEALRAFRAGLAHHKDKQYVPAVREYERSIALGGRFPEVFNNLAYCYRKLGQIDRAIELYKTAIALRPTFPQAHDYLARAYLARGDRANALRHLEIVKRLDARLAHCLEEAIRRGNPDYNDMPWGS